MLAVTERTVERRISGVTFRDLIDNHSLSDEGCEGYRCGLRKQNP